ncbi:(R)-stereoselective amidase [Caulifigura coniformis]|uniref:(R)-stereoselective amidase n=1 Tax=Caulifigura coniformis TaxID=2527983 RepID=A0A517S9A6_9PLAN|nr:carbon-nitrogen hydrolase family protein [Caulifigura coniformis]QDT52717.1 (R)-stereoselective amidase [Caulifigura coniformis]
MLIAAVQMDVKIGDVAGNSKRMADFIRHNASGGVRLSVFPECAATGYCFDSLEEGRQYGETLEGGSVETLTAACRAGNTYAVYGTLEKTETDLYNAAVLVGPQGLIATYRKVHLPWLGIDKFTTYGDRAFDLHEVDGVRLGMNICYDSGFPESSRCLALLGADLVVLPTNWPPGAECLAEHAIRTRAMENGIYYLAVNRVGEERGTTFIGRSSICAPNGDVMAMASAGHEEILIAEIDPERARRKRIVRSPGKHVIDRVADRRPDMYGPIVAPSTLRTPRQDGG